MEQEAADADQKQDDDQKGNTAISSPLLIASGLPEKPEGGYQKC